MKKSKLVGFLLVLLFSEYSYSQGIISSKKEISN